MIYNLNDIGKAKKLRLKGSSYGEIARVLNIAKSTAYFWVKKTKLSKEAQIILNNKRILSRLKALKVLADIRKNTKKQIENRAFSYANSILLDINTKKALCSFLYWGEGSKNTNSLIFTNSDPVMIQSFLSLLRSSFKLDEKKFRVLVHIHEYHNEVEIRKYWSTITSIPLSQFSKSYLKSHTGQVKKEGYKGTICISYYDYKIALELRFIYNRLAQKLI